MVVKIDVSDHFAPWPTDRLAIGFTPSPCTLLLIARVRAIWKTCQLVSHGDDGVDRDCIDHYGCFFFSLTGVTAHSALWKHCHIDAMQIWWRSDETRRMAIANWTCVSWVAYAPGNIAVNVTTIEREFNACQTHRSIHTYLQLFTSYSEILVGNRNFFIPLAFKAPVRSGPWDNRGKCYTVGKRIQCL